jgi:type II secretory pathway pseudopilin PulG
MQIAMPPARRPKQAGYSLLMVVFMVATILVFMAAATPSVLTQGTREREQETIWRGEQYKRAIGLYYRKLGRPPVKIEDLTSQTAGVRFLRKAYTDPTNKEDGSWRFIYLGPNGSLIGSLRQTSLLQNTLTPAPATGGSAFGSGSPSGASSMNSQESQPRPLDGPVIGGNIIGVGGKSKQHSFRLYKGGDIYEQWEFIYNPNGQGIFSNPVQSTPGTTPQNSQPPSGSQVPPPPTN